jgi:putative FmdB family regulatory protein
MPTYGYVCEKCGHEFEVFQSMKDEPLTVCRKDQCAQKRWGRGKVKRQLGAGAGLIFKGSGFYITDYRSPGYKEAAKKDSSAPSSSGASAGGNGKAAATPAKSESKPASSTKAST